MQYNFDEIIDRTNSTSLKYDKREAIFGTDNVLPMWVADMDFRTPDFILDAIRKRIDNPILGYFYHSKAFYSSIINWMEKRHKWHIEEEWINFSPGIVTGLSAIVQAFTNKGDKIIVQPPVYHPFYYVIENQERIIVRNSLIKKEDQYYIDFDDLEKKLKEGAIMLILSNPHNPVGRCWNSEELQKLGELCFKYNCLLVSDEIHSDLIMTGYHHTPVALLSDKIAGNTITCMAPSKSFNLAGMSSSEIIISNPAIRKQLEKYLIDRLHLHLGNTFGDVALEAAYNNGAEWIDELCKYLTENVIFAKNFMATKLTGIRTFRHEGTYLLWVDFSETGLSHKELSDLLVFKAGLGFNDGAIFGKEGEKCMRINLACPKKTVEEAMLRMKTVF